VERSEEANAGHGFRPDSQDAGDSLNRTAGQPADRQDEEKNLLKIRLARVGKKKQPTYRVVIADARAKRDGAYVEIIGHYNPRTEPNTFEIDEDKARDWLHKGAQPTERMHKLLATKGLMSAPVFPAPKPKAEARPAAGPASAAPSAPAPAATAVAEPEAPEDTAEEPAADQEATPEDAAQEAAVEEASEESKD
jgi:small subunit ribosomal protein S16